MYIDDQYRFKKGLMSFGIPAILLICFFFANAPVHAGGAIIRDCQVNGLGPDAAVKPGEQIELCYFQEGYIYSGYGDEYAYLIFAVAPELKIGGSVGRGGVNQEEDVREIVAALTKAGLLDLGTPVGDTGVLNKAIASFQRQLGSTNPDGRIDPGRRTINALNFEITDKIYAKLLAHKRSGEESNPDEFSLRDCVEFAAPQLSGSYEIGYQKLVYFTSKPITSDEISVITRDGKADFRKIRRDVRERHWFHAARIKIGSIQLPTRNLATFLRLNDKFPTVAERIEPGESPEPVKFSWYTKPDYEDVEFCYRLYPDQPDYTNWGRRNSVPYFFIGAGSHSFQVKSRYPDGKGGFVNLALSNYDFYLERPFISKPVIYKASGETITEAEEIPDFKDLYAKSKALLVGITDFEHLGILPYVDKDIQLMKGALEKHGFTITTLLGKETRDDVMTGIENFLEGVEVNDRVIIYFSTHGFQDELVKSKAYLAPYNCDPKKPGINCIELGYLESRIEQALAKKVKHLLIVLDACAAGLGVITKSPDYKELSIATENGAHMITAGMLDQSAQMDNLDQSSTFTKFLVDGLDGAADYTKDKIVTLTELLLFVRYNVANQTHGTQTPMIGRIEGSGEMIFNIGR